MGKFGGGQEFTQTEKTKLSNIGAVKTASLSAEKTITNGNSWTTLLTISNLVTSAAYFVIYYVSYKPNISGAHTPWLRLNSYPQGFWCSSNTTYPLFGCRYVSGVNSVTLDISPQTSQVTNGKVDSTAIMWAVRIK